MRRLAAALATSFAAAAAGGPAVAGEATPPPASSRVTVALGAESETIWPFTGTDFSGPPNTPINLIFLGDSDPRLVRQALLSLDGNRSAFGFPNASPFDCAWSDAIGRHETAWAAGEGWQGSAIQLECGRYQTLRFHMRLFRQGRRTLGNVHFELLIPGTVEHEVLAWEFAEAFVTLDLARSGFLAAAPAATGVINPAPSFRTARPQIVSALPVQLRAVLGLPLGNQSAPVPLPTDGRATVVTIAQELAGATAETGVEFIHQFDQVIPRPFCAADPLDFVRVSGPILMRHRVQTTASGRYAATFTASGVLQVIPVDPRTGQPTGPAYEAAISEWHRSSVTDRQSKARHVVEQVLLSEPLQSFFEDLAVGQSDRIERRVECGS